MMPTSRRAAVCAALLYSVACSDDAPAPVGAHPRFDLPADPAAPVPFLGVPWPNDVHIGASGRIVVDALPFSPTATDEAVEAMTLALAEQEGFGITSGALFALDEVTEDDPVDAATLTAETVGIVDLATGESLPAVAHVRVLDRQLHVRPELGRVLEEERTYAVLLRQGIRTVSGEPLAADPDLGTALRGEAGRAGPAYAPLRAWIAERGVDPATIVGAAVFTTARRSARLAAAREALELLPAPAATVDRVVAGEALDELLGTPAEPWPGADNPGGIVHENIGAVVLGRFAAPDYISEAPNTVGIMELDAAGVPVQKGTEDVPFVLVLPAVSAFADLPVVVFQHGINGSRDAVLFVADSLCARGFAVVGMDLPFHGDRYPEAKDVVHNYTGAAGGDGLADDSSPNPSLYLFDIVGDPATGVRQLDPRAMASGLAQAALDMMTLARLVDEGDWSALDADFPSLSFRGERIVYAGESFGSIMGAIAVRYEPRFGAAFLSVGGGGMMFPLLESSADYWPFFGPIASGTFGVAPSEVDFAYDPPHTHFVFTLLQQLLEEGDPLAHAGHLVRQDGTTLRHVALVTAFADESVPNQSSDALAAAAGLEWIRTGRSTAGPDWIAPLPERDAPVAGNLVVGAGAATAAYVQLAPATHGMLTRRFGRQDFEPGFPPFVPLDEPVGVENPIVPLQTMLVEFADTYVHTGTPTLVDPF